MDTVFAVCRHCGSEDYSNERLGQHAGSLETLIELPQIGNACGCSNRTPHPYGVANVRSAAGRLFSGILRK
jgi:hypothetical protein